MLFEELVDLLTPGCYHITPAVYNIALLIGRVEKFYMQISSTVFKKNCKKVAR